LKRQRAPVALIIILINQKTRMRSCLFNLRPTTAPTQTHAQNCRLGYYDAAAPPVMRIKSGDIVEVQTLITSSPTRLEGAA